MALGMAGLTQRRTWWPADVDALDVQASAELRHVAGPHLEEEHPLVLRQVMRIAGLAQLVLVLLGQPGVRTVGDDPDRRRTPRRG